MHWLSAAAARAGIPGADVLDIPDDTPVAASWDIASRRLGLSTAELARGLAPALGLTVADFDKADTAALAILPERIARQYHVFPIAEDKRHIVIATADPTNLDVEQAVGFATGRRPVFVLATPAAIDDALSAAHTGDRALDELVNSIDEQLADAVRIVEDFSPEAVAPAEVESTPVVKLTNLILRDAIHQGASDIHIEPGVKAGTVRFRIDGVLRRYMHLSMLALNRVVSRIKVLGKLDIADRIRPQDGRSKVLVDDKHIDLRISTVCTRDAEKAVIRILRPENTRRLDDIGITAPELARLRQLLNCRDGIVIVTGPTGSGKTTTLYSAIREIATGKVNISTVEDPVEYELAGITQIQVDPKRGITFANSLRALLRQDPDVIFVGEIRDGETAQIAAHAAMTGHLVLATLHTNDAMSSVARLLDLGLDKQTIATTLRGILAQRLIRRVCVDCAQPLAGVVPLLSEEHALCARYGVQPLSRAVGCRACGNTGYRGRLPVVEVAVITPTLADMISAGATAHALQRAVVGQGMATMRDVALGRVLRGETTLQEVERVIGDDIEDEIHTGSASAAILVVNQDHAWRRMARALLESGEFRVVEAADASQAMQLMSANERIVLTLTDMQNPAMTPVLANKPGDPAQTAFDWPTAGSPASRRTQH